MSNGDRATVPTGEQDEGAPPPRRLPPTAGEPLVETRELSTWFPVEEGLFRRRTKQLRAVDGVSLFVRPG